MKSVSVRVSDYPETGKELVTDFNILITKILKMPNASGTVRSEYFTATKSMMYFGDGHTSKRLDVSMPGFKIFGSTIRLSIPQDDMMLKFLDEFKDKLIALGTAIDYDSMDYEDDGKGGERLKPVILFNEAMENENE